MSAVDRDIVPKMDIIYAMESLLEKPGASFASLNVRDICACAKISRATFYRYFHSKHDVVQWHFDYISNENIHQVGRTLTWFEGSVRNSIECEKRKVLYAAAFQDRGYQSLIAHAKREHSAMIRSTLVDVKHIPIDAELDFQIEFVSGGEANAVARWMRNGLIESPIVHSKHVISCVPRRLLRIMDDGLDQRGDVHY